MRNDEGVRGGARGGARREARGSCERVHSCGDDGEELRRGRVPEMWVVVVVQDAGMRCCEGDHCLIPPSEW